jgi:hypothetical protein
MTLTGVNAHPQHTPAVRRRVSVLAACIALLLGGEAAPALGAGMLEFARAQRERRFPQVPREVLAFYYTWYGTPERHGRWVHWGRVNPEKRDISESTHYPARGAYDSHDPAVIDAHIDQAKAHGLTGFIATWWGQGTFDDRAFVTLLERAEKKDFKVTVYWETAPGRDQAQADKAVQDLVHILTRYGRSRAFLNVDGQPVIFVYGRVMGEVPLASWPAIVAGARARAGDFLLVADGYREDYARVFEGLHIYNNCGEVRGKSPPELRAWAADHYARAVGLAKKHARIGCVTLIPGYDDTKIRKPGLKAGRQDGQTYRVLWEEALKADPDWVLITSWNEWHEGSEIEPSWEDGDKYLKLTAEYAPQFRARPFSRAPVPASPARLASEKGRQLQQLYAGRTIGLLPEWGGEAPFWLLDAGLALKELAWADLLDPAVFNARSLPLVLHAGGEHYRRTVKTERDVERALQRYLSEGGFLMTLPHLPWPFYYDDAAGQPDPITSPLGLAVAGGWEKPPVGRALTFHLDTKALPGLPATMPFPASGDLRWRPARAAAAPKGSVYLPLAMLKDATGQSLGDGIACLEHQTPPLKPGKTLYVWMRMPDALGVDEGLLALFRFAAGKLEPVRSGP